MLLVRSLDFGPSHNRVLIRGLELSLVAGEIAVVVGPSGVGKSTFLRILCGEGFVANGTVGFDQRNLLRSGNSVRIALVEQGFPLFEDVTVIENVAVTNLSMFGGVAAGASQKAIDVLRGLGLEALSPQSSVRKLSGGEAQRVALARAIIADCPLMLLDEPFSNLDGANKTSAIRVLREHVTRRGAVAVVVLHDDFDALRLGDVVVHFQEGSAPVAQDLRSGRDLDNRLLSLGFAAPGGLQQFTFDDGRSIRFVATDIELKELSADGMGAHVATVNRILCLPAGMLITLTSLNGQVLWAFTPNSYSARDNIRVNDKFYFIINGRNVASENIS